MPPPYRIEPLGSQHDRKGFTSGVPALDRYFWEQVTQDVRRLATSCYVGCDTVTESVAGYYTISASSVPLGDLPEDVRKRLPRYPSVPAPDFGGSPLTKAPRAPAWRHVALGCREAGTSLRACRFRGRGRCQGRGRGIVLSSSWLCGLCSAPRQLFLSLTGARHNAKG